MGVGPRGGHCGHGFVWVSADQRGGPLRSRVRVRSRLPSGSDSSSVSVTMARGSPSRSRGGSQPETPSRSRARTPSPTESPSRVGMMVSLMTGMFSATKPVKEAENGQGVRRSARHAAGGAASVLEQAQARPRSWLVVLSP